MRSYQFHSTPERPRPLTVEVHVAGCDCPLCEPYRPSLPLRLTGGEIARQLLGALLLAHLLAALLLGPRTVVHLLWCDVTGARP